MKLLILSDIHANWPALEAVLRAEVSWDAVAFCGDVVDYGPHPVESLRWIGGHAEFRGAAITTTLWRMGSTVAAWGHFARHRWRLAWHRTLLAPDDSAFLRSLPTIAWFKWGGRHFRMSHATPQGDLFEYFAPNEWDQRVKDLESDYVILGHTHIQDMRRIGRLIVVNPGSVGLNRDGSGKACYAVYDGETISLKRVAYDVERTVAALWSSPLPESVIESRSPSLVLTLQRSPIERMSYSDIPV